jgi:hypothetical protein
VTVHSRLTTLQRQLLESFFALTQDYFLTGGAALAGFHLGHRETHDLDLFTHSSSLDEGVRALRLAAETLGASWEEIQTAPMFRRVLISTVNEAVVVDLVVDRTEQWHLSKLVRGTIRVDPADEILANKLCALLGRAEIRDLVDVMALEAAGLSLEAAVAAAERKDGGLTPAQLAWVLSQISIPPTSRVPGDASASELDAYRERLIDRLVRMGRPDA